tara:strand:- start:2743 stop:2952 length:210 start_codon:yes stop_codon:yes gene_type:complete
MKVFPSTEPIYGNDVIGVKQSSGMDLRDYFAIHFAQSQIELIKDEQFDALATFKTSYKLADIMMKAREK